MLSIRPIGSSSEEVRYYANLGEHENHDYYSDSGVRPGQWLGEGAEALGISGQVDESTFRNLLLGKSPDGARDLVQLRNAKRRSAFDLTFSVPKSVSVHWSQCSNESRVSIVEAINRSVESVFGVVQDLCGETRRGRNGIRKEKAKLIAAVFRHDTSRGVDGEVPDPNLHAHLVLVNATVREDGTTGALDARPLFRRGMKMALGALFRAELAKEFRTLGLEIYRPTRERSADLVSWFELRSVPRKLIRAMSKRREQVTNWLKARGLAGAKAAERAALRTRAKKIKVSERDLNTHWRAVAIRHGYSRDTAEAAFCGRTKSKQLTAADCLRRATERLTRDRARFSELELLRFTAEEAQVSNLGISGVRRTIRHAIEHSGELVELRPDGPERQFTTQEMLELEKRLLHTAHRLNARSEHRVLSHRVETVLRRFDTLRHEQAEAVRSITMSSDIVCVNGVAGAGKTFMMNAARECMEAVGKRVIGTTLSANAAAGLEKGSGIKSVHIHKLLRDIEDGHLSLDAKTTLVLDEAGMVSTRQMEKIAGIVNAAGAKLVLVGDHRQLQAIGAGAPFRLISELVGVTELNQIVRQREQRDRTLVYDLRDGRAEKALTSLAERGNLTIRDKRDELLSEVVSSWVEHPRNKAESLIFAGTNADVSAINRLCQLERLARHELSDDSVVVNGARICTHDRVMITRNHRGLMVRNGTLGEVTSTQGGQLRVRLDDGTQISLDPVHFPHVKLGYAMSIHKAQGATCERAFVMTSDSMTDREWSYVAGSRARGETRVFAQAEFVDDEIQRLADKMSRSRAKDMAHEHLLEGVS